MGKSAGPTILQEALPLDFYPLDWELFGERSLDLLRKFRSTVRFGVMAAAMGA